MANLKDIGYGVGKYLVASDASSIPDIGTNRTNIDLLNFKVATNNAYALYNFKDGMIDAYQTEGGVDATTSTNEAYDSTNKLYSPSVVASTTTAFTSTGAATYTGPTGITSATILIVAGGGGGGYQQGGGGGAGGVVHDTDYTLVAGTVYDLTVGTAGSGAAAGAGTTGANSVWNVNAEGGGSTYTAVGGGGGAGYSGPSPGTDGGSGGGGGSGVNAGASTQQSAGTPTGGTVTSYGFAGGGQQSGYSIDGGGGGAFQAGSANVGNPSGAGGASGAGLFFSDFIAYGTTQANVASSGSDGGFFGGGGGGGGTGAGAPSLGGTGGVGGGGAGGHSNAHGYPAWTGTPAIANTGGGGGGAAYPGPAGGNGGSGVILIKTNAAITNMTLLSNAQTAQADPTEGRLMIYEEDVDTITLDTDIKGYVSRDGGTTYTQTPLVEDTVYESIAFNQGGNDSYTKLLLHCDGANDGTTFTDSSASAHTVTAAGNAHTDTAIKKFGTASLQLDGTGDWLSVPDSEDWNFAAGDFTIDYWIRLNSSGNGSDGEYRMIGTYQDAQNFWRLEKRRSNDAYGELNFRWTTGNSNNILLQGAPLNWSADTWYHLAMVRYGNVFTMYRDGINIGQETNSTTLSNFTSPLTVGVQDTTGTGSSPVNGYMDEVRISKGVARWTEPFTPATRLANPYDDGTYATATTSRILSGAVDISGQPAGSNMKYKIETLNNKNLKLHGASLLWA